MSFFKKLFGIQPGASGAWEEPDEVINHEGYAIVTTPINEGGQFRLAGTISKEVDGEVKTHKLIRADLFTSQDECNEACIRKARQVIAEQGERMFG